MDNPRRPVGGMQSPGDTGHKTVKTAPQTLPEALDVIRAMHSDLLAFRNPEFDLIAPGREGEFDDRVKAVLAHSAPVIKVDRGDFWESDEKPAPQVTPADVEKAIASEHYYLASDAVLSAGATGVLRSEFGDETQLTALGMLTHCTLVLKNGHSVSGVAYCANPAKFNAQTGRESARADAIRQLWPMVIYAERERLAMSPSIQLTPAEVQSGLDRVRWAECLIKQLPADHEGRNSWLLNFGTAAPDERPESDQAA